MTSAPMTAADALARVSGMERRLDLLQYRVDGWCVWPLFRFAAARALTAGLPSGGGRGLSRAAAVGALVAHDGIALLRPRRSRLFVKTYSAGLLEREGDRYRDIWFDDIVERFGSTFKVEEATPGFLDQRRQALYPRDIGFESIELPARTLARTGRPRGLAAAASGISSAMVGELGLAMFATRFVEGTLRYFHWSRRIWSALLRRVRPAWVLVADPGEYALVAAARENRIPVAELQHGIMDASHPCYAWDDYALPHRDRLPVPDRLLLYGEHWRQELGQAAIWNGALRVVGSTRHDRHRAARRNQPGEGPARILVTSQGIEPQRMVEFVRELARSDERIHVTVKLHPVYDQGTIEWAELSGRRGITVLRASDPPSTFALVAASSLHLSISSAVHYDSLGLGVPTGILPFATSDVVAPLARAGHARVVASPAEAVELALRRETVPVAVSDHYFAANALDRIRRELAIT